MSDPRISAYATAALEVARAEGSLDEVGDELFRLGRVVDASDELRTTLTDPHLPASRRQQIVEDLLEGKASATTIGIVSMVVAAGRATDLSAIAGEVVNRSASDSGLALAEVRSAVALTDEQIARLTEALRTRTGREITVKNVVDPTVVGGIVTQIGDSVIDGSVRTRLNQLRDAF